MKFTDTVLIKCPICGHHNNFDYKAMEYYKVKKAQPFVMSCDMDDGGCDCYFVVEINLVAHVHTYKIGDEVK